MKYLATMLFLFLFFMSLSGCQCSWSYTNITVTRNKLRPVEVFERKLKHFWSWIRGNNEDTFIGRCIGGFKKLRMAINFIIFKLGVIVTALAFISALVFKSLGIGVVLLIISSLGLFSKLSLLKHGSHHSDSGQAVHLHIHNKGEHYSDIPHGHEHLPWLSRIDVASPKNVLEKQAISDLYRRVGLSRNEVGRYS